jgi:hypothetical protein
VQKSEGNYTVKEKGGARGVVALPFDAFTMGERVHTSELSGAEEEQCYIKSTSVYWANLGQ